MRSCLSSAFHGFDLNWLGYSVVADNEKVAKSVEDVEQSSAGRLSQHLMFSGMKGFSAAVMA